MRSVSTRALVNFAVDLAIAVAFLLAAVSGLVFLLPAGLLSLSGSPTRALGVGFATWRTLHDWSAVIMIAGVTLHTALHWRWMTAMVRRLAGAGNRRDARAVADSRRPLGGPRGTDADGRRGASTDGGREGDAPADTRPGLVLADGPRLGRRAFLKRAGVIAAAALAGGLVGRSAAGPAASWLGDGPGGAAPSADAGAIAAGVAEQDAADSADSSGVVGSANATGPADATDSAASGAAPESTPARVSIDMARCTGCGRCVDVCPYGVFAVDEGPVALADPAACRLCARCAQACAAGAITLGT